MPDALELPGMLRAVVPLVRGEGLAGARGGVVDELVALARGHAVGRLRHSAPGRLPCLAAVARALDDLTEPPTGLRRVQPIWIDGRALDVVDLPAREVGAGHIPPFALAIRCEDERALARPNQHPYATHILLLREVPAFKSRHARALVQDRVTGYLGHATGAKGRGWRRVRNCPPSRVLFLASTVMHFSRAPTPVRGISLVPQS